MIKQFFNLSIDTVQNSKGESRIEIAGEMTIDWGKYQAKQSLLDCLVFGDPDDPFDANTPNVSEVCHTVP